MMRIGLFVLCILLPWPASALTILVLGDSLSAAHGIPLDQGWVSLLEKQLKKEHKAVTIVNASISGETSAGGLRRLPGLLETHRPDIVILELGGNDGLRGILPPQMERNLASMIELSQTSGARILLLGMKIPSNYGPLFSRRFEAVYHRLAKRYQVGFVPFFLDGVALDANLMQDDGIHPNLQAQPILARRIAEALTNIPDQSVQQPSQDMGSNK